MGYFYRQRVMKRGWDAESHPRGKTTPESRGGSFAPNDLKDAHPEVAAEVKSLQRIGYRWLAEGRPYTRAYFEHSLQAKMKHAMGPGHEKYISSMAERIWNEYHKNGPHRYFEPDSVLKSDVLL